MEKYIYHGFFWRRYDCLYQEANQLVYRYTMAMRSALWSERSTGGMQLWRQAESFMHRIVQPKTESKPICNIM